MWPLTTFNNLRHTFASSCAMAGVPLRTLMAWMGHADIQIGAQPGTAAINYTG
jgi:integrase